MDNLNEVAQTLMSHLEKAAREHIPRCRDDFEFRNKGPNPFVPKGTGAKVPRMSETFGLDRQALEGFVDYEDSLKAALIEEMTLLKKKIGLVKDAPVPPTLQEEKRKDREIELARLASTYGQGVR